MVCCQEFRPSAGGISTPLRLLRSVSESGSTALFTGQRVLAKNAKLRVGKLGRSRGGSMGSLCKIVVPPNHPF